ncbi:methyltransferase family protein [Mycolicibacterium celeriflavum]|uniref:methyltransferase family protein n=1 Tax=Mycolicibacterium celeriflavum TaxID=1249101 RepID=UPI003CEB4ED5
MTLSTIAGLIFVALLLFVPAGTLEYWQAWVFLAIFALATTRPNFYLALRRPDVLSRRMRSGPTAERRTAQKFVSIGYPLLFVAIAVVSALDHRFGWSTVPLAVVVLGQVLVAVGLGTAMAVILVNRYAAATVTVQPDQQLVSSGFYGFVRHPMYFGVMIMMVGCPPALDSLWGLTLLVPGTAIFVLRILDEEKLLGQELPGYSEYAGRVRHRLVPYVW